jgi:hypothetical protein
MLTFIFGVMLALSLIGCDNGTTTGNTEPVPQSVTYFSEDGNGNLYTLEITEKTNRSARYAARNGDSFTFTVELYNGGDYTVALTYSGTIGTVEGDGTAIKLKITVNGKELTITIVGAEMTVISGDIVDAQNQKVVETPDTLKPAADKTILGAAIAAANAEKEGVVTSADGKDVLTTVYWVSEARMDALDLAIANAEAVYEAEDLEQQTVNSARIALVSATKLFKGQKRPGTKQETQEPNYDMYIVGNYTDTAKEIHPGYWYNGVWNSLPVPSGAIGCEASSIAVSGNNIYILGSYTDEDRFFGYSGYWLNGVWHNLPIPAGGEGTMAEGIAVSGSDVYIIGASVSYPGEFVFDYGYWLNGIWHDLVSGSGGGNIRTITTSGNDVYFGGRYNNIASYWRNGVRYDIHECVGDVISIAISGTDIHIVADGYYFINGVKQTIAGTYSNPRLVAVSGQNVLIAGNSSRGGAGNEGCYWINGTLFFTPFDAYNTFESSSIMILEGNCYIAGSVRHNVMAGDNYKRTAYLWSNNVWGMLNPPNDSISCWTGRGFGIGGENVIAIVAR